MRVVADSFPGPYAFRMTCAAFRIAIDCFTLGSCIGGKRLEQRMHALPFQLGKAGAHYFGAGAAPAEVKLFDGLRGFEHARHGWRIRQGGWRQEAKA